LSRRVQLVLLCEDEQHECFARRFLKTMGWETRGMRVERGIAGRGAAEALVRRQFPIELDAQRRRPVGQALVTVIDGDTEGVAARIRALDAACREAGVDVRRPNERALVAVPTRNIETWLAYLGGAEVDETNDTYPRLRRAGDCDGEARALSDMCRAGALREPAPPSLVAACVEYRARLAA
jgi:hypothetical protein